MDEVTEEQLMKAAEDLLRRDRLCIAMHAPGKESEKAVKNLMDLDL
jgi:hypothetical protein